MRPIDLHHRVIDRFIGRRRRKDLRRRIRAGRRLLGAADPYAHFRFVDSLRQVPLGIDRMKFKGIVPRDFAEEAVTYIRQRVLSQTVYSYLLPGMMLHAGGDAGPLVVAAPRPWRAKFVERGAMVARLRSRLAWLHLQVRMLLDGLSSVISLGIVKNRNIAPQGNYVFFDNLDSLSLPQPDQPIDPRLLNNASSSGYDLVSWYLGSNLSDMPTNHIWARTDMGGPVRWSDHVTLVRHPFPPLEGAFARTRFAAIAARITILTLLQWMIGHWWAVFVLRGAVELAYVQRIKPSLLACDHIFQASSLIVRPLWVEHAERSGSRATIIMYSVNTGRFVDGKPEIKPVDPYFGYASWKRYAVWTPGHRQKLEDLGVGPATFIEVGSVDRADNGAVLPRLSGPTVAVFDVTPFRASWLCAKGLPQNYFTTEIVSQFLIDVQSAAKAEGLHIAWKRKRAVDPRVIPPQFSRVCTDIANKENFVQIDPGIAARRLIEACEIVVSLPFTSTALIGRQLGKPSVYYDPTGQMLGFEYWSYGIRVLTSFAELRSWLREQVDGVAKPDLSDRRAIAASTAT